MKRDGVRRAALGDDAASCLDPCVRDDAARERSLVALGM